MTTYILTGNKEKCCGCGGCEQICPKNAIELKADEDGFLYPVLDKDMCVECGACKSVCPYDKELSLKEPKRVYAAKTTDTQSLMNSSSGGMFGAFAEYILAHDGFVAGCVFDENFKAEHILSDKAEDVERMRGSKYVQSETGNIFKDVKRELERGKAVLFTGTPCQIDGLKGFLKKDYEKLFTVDLICHGVPSPLLLKKYLENKEQKGKISDLKFRNKALNGWGSRGSITQSINGKEKTSVITPFNESYYNMYYLMNTVSRRCCYSCQYATGKRTGDITIGDYWNASSFMSEKETENGMSAVLCNTEKGELLLESVKNSLVLKESTLSHIIEGNGNLKAPAKMPTQRETVYKDLNEYGFEYVVKNYCRFSYLKPFIKKHIPKGIKRGIKKILE